MSIANNIAQIVQDSMTSFEQALLGEASRSLSIRYQAADYTHKPPTIIERYAYLLARFPATLAANKAVLEALVERLPDFKPRSIADIGAGPGTACWQALELFADLKQIVLVEKDPQWITLGKKLAKENKPLSEASWIEHDLKDKVIIDSADLIIASYSFQELSEQRQISLVRELYSNTKQALVIIEPGTPRGFANIKALREILIQEGAHIIAPCTHESACPLTGTNWCHFSARLQRHEYHRRLKSASMGYEDEKYSYLIVSRNPAPKLYARVLRSPQKRTGHLILDLCSEAQQKSEIVARSQKSLYREAKKLVWGSRWEKL